MGIGIVTYVEGTGIGPYEGAKVTVETSGRVSVATGIGTQGQGHYTVFAQIVAEQLGVEVTECAPDHRRHGRILLGRRHLCQPGRGGGGQCHPCRGAQSAGEDSQESQRRAGSGRGRSGTGGWHGAGQRLAADCDQTGRSGARDANPMRGAVKPGTEPGLEATDYFGPERGATASGVHAMIVEVDPETMLIEIKKYVVVHDCGVVINPMILEGQIQGGVAQGIGNAFYEQLVFDENGQLLNASFMDYLLPTADTVPHDRDRPRRDTVAAQPARHQRRGRSRRDPGRSALCPGAGRCAESAGVGDSGDSAESESVVGVGS